MSVLDPAVVFLDFPYYVVLTISSTLESSVLEESVAYPSLPGDCVILWAFWAMGSLGWIAVCSGV